MPVKRTSEPSQPADAPARVRRTLQRLLLIGAGLTVCAVLVLVLAIALAYQSLPTLDALTEYRPRMPLRVFTADGVLIGEFGGERRTVVTDAEVPPDR